MENSVIIIILITLIVLAVLVFGIGHVLSQRIIALQGRVRELAEQNEDLQRQIEGLKKDTNMTEAVPVSEPIKNPPMPLGERKPALMANKELAVVAKTKKTAPAVSAGIDPEVIAVIMAAVAACGYSPAAIQGIRRKKTVKAVNWVMAGRLAGMK
ncbi:MAG: hypothetical protein LKF74_02070 [Megasphaera sp.]|jgi:Na+-transporting methylmalonyl-CoA/oxaloacetate decarboxylase gamma subunit|nr:hypothetical protein [Megasphaera sp.]MCH4187412.1 hypothetical protein [Megasphaera sp.]MCH4217331.1 hypothetical protein [Megasphaera sp.]